jgi:hypothetical protein
MAYSGSLTYGASFAGTGGCLTALRHLVQSLFVFLSFFGFVLLLALVLVLFSAFVSHGVAPF